MALIKSLTERDATDGDGDGDGDGNGDGRRSADSDHLSFCSGKFCKGHYTRRSKGLRKHNENEDD